MTTLAKSFRFGAALLLAFILLLALAACASSGDEPGEQSNKAAAPPEQQPTAETLAPAPAPEQPKTRKVQHKMGETEVPVQPQRIVADQFMGHLMALGLKPVGVRTALLQSHHLKNELDGIADAGAPMLSPEKVISLQPDLIVSQNEKGYEEMSKIAPTIVYPYGEVNAMEQLRTLGKALGKEREAAQWIASYDEKAAKYRKQLEGVIPPGKTVSIIEVWAKSIYVYGNNWGRGGYSLYNSLQLTPPPRVKNEIIDKERYLDISMELLPEYAGDYIFLTIYGANGGTERAEEIMKSGLWQNLPAVKNKQVYAIDLAAVFDGDPISIERQMELQVKWLLEGNPK